MLIALLQTDQEGASRLHHQVLIPPRSKMQQPSDATTSADAAAAADQSTTPGAVPKDNESTEPDGSTKCKDVGAVLFKYIAFAREELDELYSAIEEFKDPIQLARVASCFTSTPQTPEAQFEFIQARISKAGARINMVHALVDNWMTTRGCKRRRLKKKQNTRNSQQPSDATAASQAVTGDRK